MKIEGESLISWEWTPPKHKKIMYTVIPAAVVGVWYLISFLFKEWTKYLNSIWIFLMIFIISFAMRGFRPQKYALTRDGVYVFDQNKRGWKLLGYWKEFIDYERGEEYIKLKKKGLFATKYIYFNRDECFKILSIVNENIFAQR